MHPRALLINLPDFDYPLGHVWGGGRDWKDVTTLMRGFDSDLATLESNYKRAHMFKHTIFVITADHGMSPTYYHIPRAVITNAASRAGAGILWNSYHTGSYVWLRDPSRAGEVAANIVGERNRYIQSVYYRVGRGKGSIYLRAGGSFLTSGVDKANQQLLSTFAGPNAPDIAVQCKEGAGIDGNGQEGWKADHGGGDWQSQKVPLIMAGPGVRPNYISHFPARLEDVAPTALTLMGMSPDGMQGTPMADAFVSAPSWAASRQTVLGKELWPLMQSLKSEAKLELASHR
jgi:arylsulfatase A-like enzyme